MRQLNKSTRRLAAGALIIVAGPVAIGSAAYACQSLSTLKVTSGSTTVQAGQSLTLFGKNYASGATNSNIEIHLDARDGAVLASTGPTSTINNLSVTIPAGTAAGTHTLIATQYNAAGEMVSGAPGRVSISVGGGAGRTSGSTDAASVATPADAPVAATPAAAAPAVAAPTAAAAPAAASASTATAPAATTTGAATVAPAAPAAAVSNAVAVDAPSTPAAAAAEVVAPVPTAGSATTSTGFLPASSSSSSTLPGLSLAAALAMVLLALGAFVKTSRSMVGRNGSLAG